MSTHEISAPGLVDAEEAVARIVELCEREEQIVEKLNAHLMKTRGPDPKTGGRWLHGTMLSTEQVRLALKPMPQRGDRFRHKVIQLGFAPPRGCQRSLCGKVWWPVAFGSKATRFDPCPECYEIAATVDDKVRVVA